MSETVYLCDPARNPDCRKTGCFLYGGPCKLTKDPAAAMVNQYGKPIICRDFNRKGGKA